MKIALSAESSIDLPKNLLAAFKIETIPFSIILGGNVLVDTEGVTDKIFDYVSLIKELPTTSAVNVSSYTEHFKKLLNSYDVVLHLSLSSTLSSAFDNAVSASKNFEEGKVVVIDSLSASCGIALLLIKAREMIDKNMEITSIKSEIEKLRSRIAISFVANNLEYLRRGGRCSKLQYLGANLLKIKPEIVYENGEARPSKKFVGLFKNVVKPYYKDVFLRYKNPELDNVFLVYTSADPKDLEYIKKNLEAKGFKNIYTCQTGGTISSHVGPSAIGLMFIYDNPQN